MEAVWCSAVDHRESCEEGLFLERGSKCNLAFQSVFPSKSVLPGKIFYLAEHD
jgi:hypothetical protein